MPDLTPTAATPAQPERPTGRAMKVFRTVLLYLVAIIAVIRGLTAIFGGSDFGTKLEFNKAELYYTKSVTADEAKRLGGYCIKEELFSNNKLSTQIDKNNGTYQFRMVLKKGSENDAALLQSAKLLADGMSREVFNGAKVEFYACDDGLKPVKLMASS
ncbi:MAG: hypothetical protein ABI946_07350 [Chthoniobacterales bacterium]